MNVEHGIETVRAELQAGMALAKCRRCGCMRETLDSLAALLPATSSDQAATLAGQVEVWSGHLEPIHYSCLGCEHCYPGVAQNAFSRTFPDLNPPSLSCDFRPSSDTWPAVPGEYFVLEPTAPIAVSTLASTDLAEELARRKPNGLAIVGKTETENIGVDKVIKNVITNPSIRFLIVSGADPAGHLSGATLLALARRGVDATRRVKDSPGRRPVLRNVTAEEIEVFRQQAQVIDMIGCEDLVRIESRIEELTVSTSSSCTCGGDTCAEPIAAIARSAIPTVFAHEPGAEVRLDRAGYFVILPSAGRGVISVEHYAYDNTLLHVIEGKTARAIYNTIVTNGWVTELAHAAYLGKELAKAEMAGQYGFKYVQDGA